MDTKCIFSSFENPPKTAQMNIDNSNNNVIRNLDKKDISTILHIPKPKKARHKQREQGTKTFLT